MARRFRGEDHHKVDSKGRVSIPASFRRVLQECDPDWAEGASAEMIIVYGDERRNFLECYTMEAIAEVDEKIAALPRGSKARKILQRLFHGQSLPTNVEENGRLVLPARLREKLNITNEAFFIGDGDTFQIWHPDTYMAEAGDEIDGYLDELPDDFDPVRLLDEAFPEQSEGA